MTVQDITRYELPKNGISLLGYVVRRMHKTSMIIDIQSLLRSGKSDQALAQVAKYAAASSTSYGPAYYQPRFDPEGASVSEADPQTGAMVTAHLEAVSPVYKISYTATMPNGDLFSGSEEIQGTTVSLRGLGMPAPSKFKFNSGQYAAELSGILTSELALSLIGRTRIRAYGFLNFNDNAGNAGKLTLDRNNQMQVVINSQVYS